MSNTTKEIYQENQIITKSINKIIEEASTDREILAKLRNLKAATQTQLAKSQIDYYIHQIQRQHQKKARHMVLYIALLFYLLLFCTALICTCIQRLTQLHPSLVQQRNNLYILLCKALHSMHILLNPISVTDYRIQDKYQTYQDIVNYLNQYTHTLLLIYT